MGRRLNLFVAALAAAGVVGWLLEPLGSANTGRGGQPSPGGSLAHHKLGARNGGQHAINGASVSWSPGWSDFPGPPGGSLEGGAAWYGGELWVAGGYPCAHGTPFETENVWKYSPESRSWSPGPKLPGFHAHHAFSTLQETKHGLVFFGGVRQHFDKDKDGNRRLINDTGGLLVIPPGATTWEQRPPPGGVDIGGMAHCTSMRHGPNRLQYCLFGCGGDYLNDTFRFYSFDPNALTFDALPVPPMPTTHAPLLLDAPRERVIIISGRPDRTKDRTARTEVMAYEIRNRRWTPLGNIPDWVYVCEGRGYVQIDDGSAGGKPTAFLFGGQNNAATEFTVRDLSYRVTIEDDGSLKWEPWTRLPFASFGQAVVAARPPVGGNEDMSGGMLVLGGSVSVGAHCTSASFVYDGSPDPAVQASAPRLLARAGTPPRVVAAFLGPHLVTAKLQSLLESGVDRIHMNILPDLGVPEMKGVTLSKWPLVAVIDVAGEIRTVSCPVDSGCRFYGFF
ncbi:hypothetical protein DFJ74DRAFT_663327 [Hyaloraphidium curvatum]|nr:hypothetical protein DFJ74DRAFT_663327 [Hyaloraphidium curvatum]